MKTQCPNCKTIYNVKEVFLNKKTKCIKCNQAFVLVSIDDEYSEVKIVVGTSGDHELDTLAENKSNKAIVKIKT